MTERYGISGSPVLEPSLLHGRSLLPDVWIGGYYDILPGCVAAVSAWGSPSNVIGTLSQPSRAILWDGTTGKLLGVSEEIITEQSFAPEYSIFQWRFPTAPIWGGGKLLIGIWGGGTDHLMVVTYTVSPFAEALAFDAVVVPDLDLSLFPGSVDDYIRLFVMSTAPWIPPLIPTEQLAAMGWASSQRGLGGSVVSRPEITVSAEWHGTGEVDSNRGAFAVVAEGGPLADAVGDVLLVKRGRATAYVYVTASSDELDMDLSLARRAFMQLGDLSEESLPVRVQVVRGAS